MTSTMPMTEIKQL